MDSPELVRLKGKWLLLDTSVLIKIAHLGDDVQTPLITVAEKYNCILTVHDLILPYKFPERKLGGCSPVPRPPLP